MRHLLCGVFLLAALSPARADEPNAGADKALAALLRVFNAGSAEEFHQLLTAKAQKALPLPQATAALKYLRLKFGKITGAPALAKTEGDLRFYRVGAEKGEVVLKVVLDKEGRFDTLFFHPAFLGLLPDGPLSPEEVQKRLSDAVEQTLKYQEVPSISLALVKEDRLVWAKAFGYLNAAKKVPADTETAYVTGSIFKVVVATAAMQLVDEGKLDLDVPVNSYVKGFHIPNPYDERPVLAAAGMSTVGLLDLPHGSLLAAAALVPERMKATPLTMRHLLSHRGGWPNPTELLPLWGRKLLPKLEDEIRSKARVITRPGERTEYSNLAFAFNGWLVGELSGRSVDAAFKKRLFEPLEMTRTMFDPSPELAENLAIPYQRGVWPGQPAALPYYRFAVYPAGEVYSTPTDMAHFLLLHLNGGKYKGTQIVSERSIHEMARLQFAGKDDKSGFGLGWFIAPYNTRTLLMHDGRVPGFRTTMMADPARRVGVVLFTNKTANPAEALTQSYVEPLPDLAFFAIELLDRMK